MQTEVQLPSGARADCVSDANAIEVESYSDWAQGIGQALLERTVYDEDGQILSASLMDYALPRAEDIPGFHFETRNVPSKHNDMGIKGAGEAGSIGSCGAVMNSLCDALWRNCGVPHVDMPATPDVLWRVISSASRQAAE